MDCAHIIIKGIIKVDMQRKEKMHKITSLQINSKIKNTHITRTMITIRIVIIIFTESIEDRINLSKKIITKIITIKGRIATQKDNLIIVASTTNIIIFKCLICRRLVIKYALHLHAIRVTKCLNKYICQKIYFQLFAAFKLRIEI